MFLNVSLLYIISKTSKNSIIFNMPKIGKGFSLSIFNRAKLNISNLVARNNLSLFVSQGQLTFKKGCFVNNNCSFNCLDSIQIGENTIFGEGVKVYDHDHIIDNEYYVSKNEFITSAVKIGSNCWFGTNTIILKGVSITDNVIIGANSLVNKSISEPGVYVSKNGVLTKIK